MTGDRNLLLGVLALQMDFITRDQLIHGMNAWVLDKQKPLGEILRDHGHLTPSRLRVLDELVAEHIQAHQGDVHQSLAAVPTASGLKSDLKNLRDPELQASLVSLGTADVNRAAGATADYAPANGIRYKILRPHAEGGLGEVFVAQDTELHREVALKQMKHRSMHLAHGRGRFLLEAEITGMLEHPGIVPVYGLGTYPDGRPYYAMRFIQGDNLKEAIARFHRNPNAENLEKKRRAPTPGSVPHSFSASSASSAFQSSSLGFRNLLRRFIDVCNAVAYAHSRGVLHRDLKPGNVMLGKFGETLVVDWGLAKVTGTGPDCEGGDAAAEATLQPSSGSGLEPTQMGSAIGTPAYMSPEQAAGRLDQLGPATDVYALGATLYTVLTNRPPVDGENVGEILRKVQRGEAGFNQAAAATVRSSNAEHAENAEQKERTRRVGPGAASSSMPSSALSALKIPGPLKAICRKAMSLNPADRQATALDLARDVERYLADEPVSCYAEPWTVRTRRWSRKHRTLVASAAAVLLMAAFASILGVVILTAKNQQLEVAYAAEQTAKKEAQENFKEALDAVKAQVFDIDRELKNRAGTRDLREKLQKSATERLKKLVERATQRAAVDHTAFWAHANLGDVYLEVDLAPSLAKVEYDKAEAIAKELVAADLSDAQAQRDLSVSFSKLGDVTRQLGQPARALEYYTQMFEIRKKLAAADPSNTEAQTDLFISYWKLGEVDKGTGRYAEAIGWYRKGLEVLRPLHSAGKLHGQFKDGVAIVEKNLAACELLLKLSPGLIDDPSWSVLWSWPRF